LPPWLAVELERTGHLIDEGKESRASGRHTDAVTEMVTTSGLDISRRIMRTVVDDILECASVLEGSGFAEKLNRAAYTAGGLIAAGLISEAETEQMLLGAAITARPMKERYAVGVIRSGMRAGALRPFRVREST
jgi:hypothetical protein